MPLKIGEIYSHFLQQEIVLLMDLGSSQVSEGRDLGVYYNTEIISGGMAKRRTNAKPFPSTKNCWKVNKQTNNQVIVSYLPTTGH